MSKNIVVIVVIVVTVVMIFTGCSSDEKNNKPKEVQQNNSKQVKNVDEEKAENLKAVVKADSFYEEEYLQNFYSVLQFDYNEKLERKGEGIDELKDWFEKNSNDYTKLKKKLEKMLLKNEYIEHIYFDITKYKHLEKEGFAAQLIVSYDLKEENGNHIEKKSDVKIRIEDRGGDELIITEYEETEK